MTSENRFLALGLFVGRWIEFDNRERDLNHRLMRPILFLTLAAGSDGLLASRSGLVPGE